MMISNDSISRVQEGNSTIPGRLYPHPAQEVIMWLVVLLNLTLNLLVFVVLPRIKTLRVSTTVGMLSLAITDFAVGITGLITMIYNRYTGYQLQTHHPLCAAVSYGYSLFAAVSVLMLAYLNIDRLLTFKYPLKYQLSKKRAIIISTVIWVAVIVFQLPYVTVTMGFQYYEHAFLCLPVWTENVAYKAVWLVFFSLIPTIINIVSFFGSFYLIRSRHRRLSLRAPAARVYYGRQLSDNPDSQWSRDRKTFKVLAIMTFGFYISWVPYITTVAFPEIATGQTVHPVTDFVGPQLAASNSFWNPIIYMLTLRPFTMILSQLCRNTPCGRYMCRRTGGSAQRLAASLNRGTSDNNTEDDSNATQDQGVVEQNSRF